MNLKKKFVGSAYCLKKEKNIYTIYYSIGVECPSNSTFVGLKKKVLPTIKFTLLKQEILKLIYIINISVNNEF